MSDMAQKLRKLAAEVQRQARVTHPTKVAQVVEAAAALGLLRQRLFGKGR